MTDIITRNSNEVSFSYLNDTNILIEQFLLEHDCFKTTKASYKKALKQFFGWITDRNYNIAEIKREHILEYKTFLSAEKFSNGRGLSSKTIGLYLSALRQFYAWAETKRFYPNITAGIKTPKQDKKFKSHLLDSEAKALLNYYRVGKDNTWQTTTGQFTKFKNNDALNARNFAIVNLMLRTGLRTVEITTIKVGDIYEMKGSKILKVRGKGHSSADSTVVLTEKAFTPILDYMDFRDCFSPDEPLFLSEGYGNKVRGITSRTVQKIIKDGYRAVGLNENYTPHCLRHTAAVQIIKNGGSVFDVQTVLRHSDPATSQIYLDSIKEEERLINAPEHKLDNAFD